jgi:hypothetical protein
MVLANRHVSMIPNNLDSLSLSVFFYFFFHVIATTVLYCLAFLLSLSFLVMNRRKIESTRMGSLWFLQQRLEHRSQLLPPFYYLFCSYAVKAFGLILLFFFRGNIEDALAKLQVLCNAHCIFSRAMGNLTVLLVKGVYS